MKNHLEIFFCHSCYFLIFLLAEFNWMSRSKSIDDDPGRKTTIKLNVSIKNYYFNRSCFLFSFFLKNEMQTDSSEWEIVLATITNWKFKYILYEWKSNAIDQIKSNLTYTICIDIDICERSSIVTYECIFQILACALLRVCTGVYNRMCCFCHAKLCCVFFLLLKHWIKHTTMVWSTSFNWNEFQVCLFFCSFVDLVMGMCMKPANSQNIYITNCETKFQAKSQWLRWLETDLLFVYRQ